ncbi:MAG: hypothetical protein ACPGJS_16505 [Flammeovirgaceae bacterium]
MNWSIDMAQAIDTAKFFKWTGIITLVMILGIVGGDQLGWFKQHPYTWWILAYHLGLTTISFFMLRQGMKSDDGFEFYNHFMGNVAIRLLLSAAVLFIYYFKVKVENISFTITFFAFYFTYTVFEIKYLLANLRPNSESDKQSNEKK